MWFRLILVIGVFAVLCSALDYYDYNYDDVENATVWTSTEGGEIKSKHGKHGSREQTTCKCGWKYNQMRIVGGETTRVNEYPFIVGLKKKRGRSIFCGGVIITNNHVLTAAHCVDDVRSSDLQIVVGEHDVTTASETSATVVHNIARVAVHSRYNANRNMNNDIAILLTERRIEFNQRVGPVCMPNARMDLDYKPLRVIGWGLTSNNGAASNVLRSVVLKALPLELCNFAYPEVLYRRRTQICTYAQGKDSCQGDSGGPLVYNDPEIGSYVLAGLVSYGRDCASRYPGVNTDVSAYLDWIKSRISDSRRSGQMCTVRR